jgi:hypothetical protein
MIASKSGHSIQMRGIVILILLHTFSVSGFAQKPHWKDGEASIPAVGGLDLLWMAPTAAIPDSVWIYRLLPNKFSPEIISNVTGLCSLTAKEKVNQSTNGATFKSRDGSRKLSISFQPGSIDYETAERQYGPTNLAEGVPAISELPKRAADFITQAGIKLSEITNPFAAGGSVYSTPRFHFSEPMRIYYVGSNNITNVEYRTVKFWRCVDGIPVIGGDGGTITFGEHGTIRGFSIIWRTLERHQSVPSVTPETAMKFLREGKAVQELIEGEIDWAKVKSVTIKKASPLYFDGHTEWLWPFLGLVAVTEPSYGHTQFGIECPIIDETKVGTR